MATAEPFFLPRGPRGTEVVCLGHALVDRLVHVEPAAVASAGLEAGAMTLVDAARAREIASSQPRWEEEAGGSAANTASGIASLGGSAALACSIGADEAGRRYVADLESKGVRCEPALAEALPTGVCHVLITPDGLRSMATCLGAAAHLDEGVVEAAGIPDSLVLYVEGYLLDAPGAAAAVKRALEVARAAGTTVALSLSDPFVVERHRQELRAMIEGGTVGVLFSNESEALALASSRDLDQAMAYLSRKGLLAVVTRGPHGSVATAGPSGGLVEQAAVPVERVVDTTGAGDLFAAGALFGIVRHLGLAEALRLGSLAAAEVISHVGARPEVSLAALAGLSR